jgi:hypothetical protein
LEGSSACSLSLLKVFDQALKDSPENFHFVEKLPSVSAYSGHETQRSQALKDSRKDFHFVEKLPFRLGLFRP